MNYAIRVSIHGRAAGSHGWISAYGYTTALNIASARRFETREEAESFALVLAAKIPHYIQRLKVVEIVLKIDRNGDVRGYEATGSKK